MKILIVNGYSKSVKGKETFARYQELIQETFRNQRDFIDTNYEFIIRHRDDLDEFLYELDSAYVRKANAKTFDHIDMVFMEGDPSLLPWSPQAQKVDLKQCKLIMCLRVKKILFASSFAMQALCFLSATNIEKGISIMNGSGKGGKIGDIIHMQFNPTDLKPNEYFLDNVTGDLYSYSYETNEWIPRFNVGLHYVKAAQAFDSLGKFIIKTPVYKTKNIKETNPHYLSNKHTEDFCYLKKIYLQHWALQGLDFEFVIPAKNTWDIHQFNFVNPNKTFVVLAESKRSPQIIYFDSFCIATLFNINKRYPQTYHVLQNFIIAKLKEIKSMGKEPMMSIEKASEMFRTQNDFFNFSKNGHEATNDKVDGPRRITLLGVDKQRSQSSADMRPKTASTFFHSGFAFSHHDGPNLIVENNTVRTNMTIKMDQAEKTKSRPTTTLKNSRTRMNYSRENFNSMGGTDEYGLGSTEQSTGNRPWSGANNDVIAIHNFIQRQIDTQNGRKNSFSQYMDDGNLPQIGDKGKGILKANRTQENLFKKNKAEVAMMLYPEIPKDTVEEEELWIPGKLSETRMKKSSTSKEIKKVVMESAYSSRFYSTFNKFRESNPDEARSKPWIRTAGEYMTEKEKKRKEEKEALKTSLAGNFKCGDKATKPVFIPNYVSLTLSKPTVTYKYREISKEKWLAGDMKLC